MNKPKPKLIRLFASMMLLAPIGFGTAFAQATNCAAVAQLALPHVSGLAAVVVPEGELAIANYGQTTRIALPSYCRVRATVAGSIRAEVWLPTVHWNGQLLSVGNGGFAGSLPIQAMADGLRQGFAVTGNDTGHQGNGREWMRDPAKVLLWGHSATHWVTAPAKAIVAAYYRHAAAHAYFQGCSTGGAQAMEEAEFYPRDYNGIVAGAPGMSYARLMLSFLWGLKVSEAPNARLGPTQLAVLHQYVLDQCDAADGKRDGLISDPLACHIDPFKLICRPGQDGKQCLTGAQARTASLLYQGPRNPRTGAQIYPGMVPGSEWDAMSDPGSPFSYGWIGIQGPLARMFAIPLLRDMVYHDPTWDWHHFDWDHDVTDLDHRIAAQITATDPDLSGFARSGGKLLMYQGLGDPLNAQTYPLIYREQVRAALRRKYGAKADQTLDGFFQLFLVPGMAHCLGGPGPSEFDSLSAMRSWVESGVVPRVMLAKTVSLPGMSVTHSLQRPICAYPAWSVYAGSGDGSKPGSFVCKAQ